MYGWFFAFWGIVAIVKFFEKALPELSILLLVFSIIFGIFANSLYHDSVKKKIAVAQLTIKNEAQLLEFLRYKGGVNTWVAWVFGGLHVIGIVASIAIPAFLDHKIPSPQVPSAVVTTETQPENKNFQRRKRSEYFSEMDAYWDEIDCKKPENKNSDTCESVLAEAAEQGDAVAQHHLGNRYFSGDGITKDDAQALFWWRKSAEQGDAGGQSSLGLAYEKGLGVEKDDAQAVFWYRKAYDGGRILSPEILRKIGK